jgi:segregation and condensation protein B
MSLKAKIEAVIYASEEPVTLAQLAGLLGHEAQAEIDFRDSGQQVLPLDEDQIPESDNTAEIEAALELATPGPEASPEAATEQKDEKAPIRQERENARRLREYFRSILDELIADYATHSNDRGLEIREVAGGFRLATKPEYHDAVRGFVKSLKPPLKLSLQALETLAVVAYKQPVTAPEISEIRGVDSGGVLGSLMARKLITTAGRKQVIGRPILYKTTRDFLLRFGLKDVSELPSIEEFEKMATELAESDAVQEEIPMPDPHHAPELQKEHGAVAPQPDGNPTPLATTADMSPTPDGKPTDPPSVRLSGPPPASVVPGTDDDPTEAAMLARQNERDRKERAFPQEGSIPSLQPK